MGQGVEGNTNSPWSVPEHSATGIYPPLPLPSPCRHPKDTHERSSCSVERSPWAVFILTTQHLKSR